MKVLGAAGIASMVSGSASANSAGSGPAQVAGPLRNSRFIVEIDGIDVAGFSRVELPTTRVTNVEYREGNDPSFDRQLDGLQDGEALVLERGIQGAETTQLWDWFKQARDGKLEEARRVIAVQVLDSRGQPQARFEFADAWPTEYSPPTLDANDPGSVATESLTLVYSEFERTA